MVSVLLAFDDTDGPEGGCTTHLAFHVLLALPELALRGPPRLVRLNPNIPWKTRGNGAVVLPLGRPEGPSARVGELQGHEILAFPDGADVAPDEEILKTVRRVLQEHSQPDASPAIFLAADPPPALAYWNAVRAVVDPKEVKGMLRRLPGVLYDAKHDGRGLVGAVGASAWPGPPTSFEFIAYRDARNWGKPRLLDEDPIWHLERDGVTFHSVDTEAERLACVPNTPCPVLCGLRGTDPDRLRDGAVKALAEAANEPVDGWIMWATNHASGDHVNQVRDLAHAAPDMTIQVDAKVTTIPETVQGGHVFVGLQDQQGKDASAVAFEPTKEFREVIRLLRPGDAVSVVGAYKDGAVQLEKLRVLDVVGHHDKKANPICCGKSMKSRGEDAGYKCGICGKTATEEDAEWEAEDRRLVLGWHEVPVMAQRHLHRPVRWGAIGAGNVQ